MKNENPNRLSKLVCPTEYHIQLRPDLENFTFEGIETITIEVLQKTKVLTLHAKELEIETAQVTLEGEKVFGKISYDLKSETASFTFPRFIGAGNTKLTLVFRGILNEKMRGFYRSKYLDIDKEKNIATTQFEATDARRAFPCFDEPAQKAVFNVSLIVPDDKTAISNTLPTSVQTHEAGFKIVNFEATPKMSTYLLAFIIGDFEYLEKKSSRGVQVRVYTTPGKKHLGKFALDVTVKVLEFYEKYFDIPYPLKTLDMIAIPDFTSLAMENWGAITFREIGLLVDEKNTSAKSKELVAEVIAHELAHQWFGNLVTMEWWTHLWLNEGFASYISYLAVDKLFPKWNVWTQFTTKDLGVALRLDALANTHPIEVEVHHPNEIGEIFDEVSYSKGASIIRMLASYLGEKDFRDGLRYYLKKHSYKNTETIHLWQAFEKVSGKKVAKMMHGWTSRPGYPVVKITLLGEEIKLAQERFFASPISKNKERDKTVWEVPLVMCFKKAWLKVNAGEMGFFRTAYSKELLENLRQPVEKKILSPKDRLGIIRDLFAFSESGVGSTVETLDFLKSYKTEDNYTVWVEIVSGLERLLNIFAKGKIKKGLHKFTIALLAPIFKKLGWNGEKSETYNDTVLRPLLIGMLGHTEYKKIISQAQKEFSKIKKGEYIDPNLRGAIYSVMATFGGTKEYKTLVKQYQKETLHEEKNRLGNALGNFRNPTILKQACQFAFSKQVRPQDATAILSRVGANHAGRDVWLAFVTKNWKMLMERYGDGGHVLSRVVKAVSGSAEEKHLKTFKNFFKTHDAPGAERAVEQVLERLESNIAQRKRDEKSIKEFLRTY